MIYFPVPESPVPESRSPIFLMEQSPSSPTPSAPTSGMLGWRLAVSCLLIPALIGLFALDVKLGDRAPLFLLFCLLLALRGTWELVELLRVRTLRPNFMLVVPLVVTIVLAPWSLRFSADIYLHERLSFAESLASICFTFTCGVLLLFLFEALRFEAPGISVENLGAHLLVITYTGLLLAVTAQLRWVRAPGIGDEPPGPAGYYALGALIVAVKCGDIGAYTFGRLFGKRKMSPKLSPGKTWMGAVGALLFATLAAWFWLSTMAVPLGYGRVPRIGWCLSFGLAMGAVGLIGDLCESLIKRDTGHKDAAALFPGFGGLLDMLDSILYAGPIAVLLWRF